MLQTLDIRDFALIEHISVDFSAGLNVLTGETGAGKSIIIDALSAVLGAKAGPNLIRNGAEKATIEATFKSSPQVSAWLKANELVDEEVSELVVYREINKTGSRSRVNGTPVNSSILQELKQYLLTLHAQHEARTLMLPQYQLAMLDALGDTKHQQVQDKVKTLYTRWKDLKESLEEQNLSNAEREKRLDFARFQLAELLEAALTTADEDEKLEGQCRILANVADLDGAVSNAYGYIKGSESEDASPIIDLLQKAISEVKQAADLDPELSSVIEPLTSSLDLIEEAGRDLRRYRDTLDTDPEHLASIESRLGVLTTIKRKYGPSLTEAIAKRDELQTEIDRLENSDATLDQLNAEIAKLDRELNKTCSELSTKRQAIAKSFTASILSDLQEMGMERCQFEASFTAANLGPSGTDKVEFLIAPNPGQPLMPVAKIASGGELSRVMLAIKARLAAADEVSCVIFDEIDTGLSGRVLQAMRDKLAALAASHQILCITHQPIIASVANSHVLVSKQQTKDKTSVHVEILNDEKRLKSLAAMASGKEDETTALAFAQSLIDQAAQIRPI
ncbi:MAG: DNA repair protein RecN [Candidatus Obscuribacterales bacterium]|nr:DNA repair protein RecN [Candidatus Obscuribacterales bacterium]